jgi:hypothetical protein
VSTARFDDPVHALNAELAAALGLPPKTFRAVLELEAGKAPLLVIMSRVTDSQGMVQRERKSDGTLADRLKQVRFIVRLERATV